MADAGYRLSVEGEKEFKKALAEINAQIKVNKSELKLLTAEYEINDDKLGNLQKKQETLTAAMENQTQKVKIAEERYKAWEEELGEGDAKVLRLKESLNLAQTELAQTTAEWQKNQQAIENFASSADTAVGAEQKLKGQIGEINGTLEVNASRLKLLDAQYGSTEESAEGLRTKNEVLADSIEKQREKIELLSRALQDSEKEFGQQSEEVRDYQIQLNNAQAELAGMTKQLEKNNDALNEESGKGFEGMQESLDGIIDSLGIEMPAGIDKVISGITGSGGMVPGFAMAAAGVGAVITAVKNLQEDIQEAASRSSEIIDTASIYGMSLEELQEWQYAAPQIGIEVESIGDAFKELAMKMAEARDGNEDAVDAFRKMGVEIEDENGKLRDTSDVFDDLIYRYGGIQDETERAARMMEMFGEEALKLNPILEKGAGIVEAYKNQAHELGFVLSDELLETMDEVDRRTQRQTLLVEAENAAWSNMWVTFGKLVSGEASFKDLANAGSVWYEANSGAWKNLVSDVEESIEQIEDSEKEMSAERLAMIQEMYDQEAETIAEHREERTEELEKANEQELEDFQELQEEKLEAFEKAQSKELKAYQKAQSQRKKEFDDALKAEMDALDASHREKLAQINEEYTERIKLVDEDRYKALQAIEGMIEDLDKLTEAEEKAEEERRKRESIAAAEEAIARAETAEEREQAEKEYSELLAEYERERVLEAREAERKRLENMLLSVNEEYDRRVEVIEKEITEREKQAESEYDIAKAALEEEQALRKEAFSELLSNELDAFRENQAAQKESFKETLDLELEDHKTFLEQKLKDQKEELEDEIAAEREAASEKRKIWENAAENNIDVWKRMNADYAKELRDTLTENLPFLDRKIDLSDLPNIPRYASGTLHHPGGLALVGERGPELVSLPAGTAVYPNEVLRQSSGAVVNNWYVSIPAKDVKEFNNIVRIAEQKRTDIRMGYTGG